MKKGIEDYSNYFVTLPDCATIVSFSSIQSTHYYKLLATHTFLTKYELELWPFVYDTHTHTYGTFVLLLNIKVWMNTFQSRLISNLLCRLKFLYIVCSILPAYVKCQLIINKEVETWNPRIITYLKKAVFQLQLHFLFTKICKSSTNLRI